MNPFTLAAPHGDGGRSGETLHIGSVLKALAAESGASVEARHDPIQAVEGAQAVYTDVWTSMGQEYAAHLRS